jgi:NAD(P)-dependent dehydrogenase (short-subunit alcohol dehydrogenase family)
MRLDGKTALIVGGAGGIGAACCRTFADAGAAVVIADVAEDRGVALAEELAAKGAKAAFVRVDVTDEQSCADMVAFTVKRFGGLDCAVNLAGFGHTPTPIHEIEQAVWRRIWEVATLGTALCIRHQVPAMLARSGGSIVNVASGAGLRAAPGMSAYVSAKHAVVGMTKNAALDLAKQNIRVNAICPGLIATGTHNRHLAPGESWGDRSFSAMGRPGKPEEVADLALYLASDASSFVNGEAIGITGGRP